MTEEMKDNYPSPGPSPKREGSKSPSGDLGVPAQRSKSPSGDLGVPAQRKNLTFITIPKEEALATITRLRDHEGYEHLVLLTAVDWIEQGLFQLTYLLNHPVEKRDLGIRVMISRDEPVMDSIHPLWAQAATYQRELREMFGIDFPGSPRVDQPFILEGWDGPPPYRRDFDTKKYSEETYFPRPGRESHDPEAYMKQKLYPDE